MIASQIRKNKRISLARRRAEMRSRGYNMFGKIDPNDLDLSTIYEDLSYVKIENRTLTMEAMMQADQIFNDLISHASCFRNSKLKEKQKFWRIVFHALRRASFNDGCVAYPHHRSKMPQIFLQTIQAAEQMGLVRNVISSPGAPKMSRLLPMPFLEKQFSADPWEFDADQPKRFVYLFKRRSENEEISFDTDDPIPSEIQKKLVVINSVNSHFEITYSPFSKWTDKLIGQKQLRPIHYARFTKDWEHHGRLYTGKYGHQSLRAVERQQIRFNGQESIELDFSGMHVRMLYHLIGLEYLDDPYTLWGADTSDSLRFMAKICINAAINAKSKNSARSACNQKMNLRTNSGEWKTGKSKNIAMLLLEASRETGITFSEIYDLAFRRHHNISKYFGSDAGMKLMNLDGKIALNILNYFCKAGVPCLSVHDSFIVPACFDEELRASMSHFYHQELGHSPIIK